MKKLFEMFVKKINRKSRKIIQKKSIFSCFSESRQFRQTRIKSIDSQENLKNSIMLAKKQFRKSLNAIRKRMRFSFFSMFDQIKIINYFKFVDQSFKSFKFNVFINCFCSISRICFSVNRVTEISQYQNIAIDEIFDLETQQKIKNCFLSRSFEQEYIVVADVDYIKKDIRVETLLTNAKKYNYNSIKSSIKLFKSLKSFRKFKFSIFNSISRVCSSVNQLAETSQYQHIEIDKIKSLKSFKSIKLLKSLNSAAIINSLNSTFLFSLSVNHDSLISSRIDFLRALINQMIYVSINSRFRRFRQRYIVVVVTFIDI